MSFAVPTDRLDLLTGRSEVNGVWGFVLSSGRMIIASNSDRLGEGGPAAVVANQDLGSQIDWSVQEVRPT